MVLTATNHIISDEVTIALNETYTAPTTFTLTEQSTDTGVYHYLERFTGPEDSILLIDVVSYILPSNTEVIFGAGSEVYGSTVGRYTDQGAISPYSSHQFYVLDNEAFMRMLATGNNRNIAILYTVTALEPPGKDSCQFCLHWHLHWTSRETYHLSHRATLTKIQRIKLRRILTQINYSTPWR